MHIIILSLLLCLPCVCCFFSSASPICIFYVLILFMFGSYLYRWLVSQIISILPKPSWINWNMGKWLLIFCTLVFHCSSDTDKHHLTCFSSFYVVFSTLPCLDFITKYCFPSLIIIYLLGTNKAASIMNALTVKGFIIN